MHTHIHAQISHSRRFLFGSSMSIALADACAGPLNKIASIQWNSAIKKCASGSLRLFGLELKSTHKNETQETNGHTLALVVP